MEPVIKVTDVKSLQEISKVIIVPMLISAFLIQNDFSIFGIYVDKDESVYRQLIHFLYVFSIYSLIIAIPAICLHKIFFLLQLFTNFTALSVLSTIFLAFGFLGVFSNNAPLVSQLNSMWFYTAFVCGFYFLSRASDVDNFLDK
jgi:hypothetical protein